MKIILLLIFWSLWFLNFTTRSVLSPLLPIIEDELAISHAMAGSFFFYISIGFTITVFMTGQISKAIGYKRAIISSLSLLVLVLVSLHFADTYLHFAIIAFFMGIGSGIYLPCAIPLITSIFSRDNWGKVIGFHETAASASFLSIPILVAVVLRFFHWKSIFLMTSGAFLVFIILFWVLAPDTRAHAEKKAGYLTIIRRKEFWILTLLWSMAAMSTAGVYSITPLYLVKEKGIALEFANTVFGISRVGGLFATIYIGFILDRFNVKNILTFIILVTGLSTVGIALAPVFWLLVCMLIIQATVCMTFFPTAIMTISKLTPLEERGTFMGMTLAIASTCGGGMSPVALGFVADRWSFGIGILVMGVLTALSSIFIRKLSLTGSS
ncbi:MAG: MFS transporter [Deltaproteobacteria bacterium]|nr:MFS transporter [Deltaproteobacteria bacterium]